jgi:hypothetical protein
MAKDRRPDRSRSLGDLPSDVEVTILSSASGPTLRERIAHVALVAQTRAIVGLVLVIAAAGALVAGLALGDRGSGGRGPTTQAHDEGAAGVAAAYGYPLRCLTITISQADPTYARADLGHTGTCWRYQGDVTAVFHRVDGAWRALLRGGSYSCPVASLPRAVQADLAVCPQTTGPPGLV